MMSWSEIAPIYYGVLIGATCFAYVGVKKRIGHAGALFLVGALFVPFAIGLFILMAQVANYL